MNFIGDVHGKTAKYLYLVNERLRGQHTVQVGDMGFDYSFLHRVDENLHRFVPGNHDNYDAIASERFKKWVLSPFGLHHETEFVEDRCVDTSVFYIRGAFSIDRAIRTSGLDWWAEEELSWKEADACLEMFALVKPRIVVSHDTPNYEVVGCVGESFTRRLLQECLAKHRPEIWVHGHHHKCARALVDGTFFASLAELEVVSLRELERQRDARYPQENACFTERGYL